MMKKIEKPPLLRKWYRCPHCGKNAVLYDNTAHSNGVYVKCKECRKEFEIRICEPVSRATAKGVVWLILTYNYLRPTAI